MRQIPLAGLFCAALLSAGPLHAANPQPSLLVHSTTNTYAYDILDQWQETHGLGTNTRLVTQYKFKQRSTGKVFTQRKDPRVTLSTVHNTKAQLKRPAPRGSKIDPRLREQFTSDETQALDERRYRAIIWFDSPTSDRNEIESLAFPQDEPSESTPEKSLLVRSKNVADHRLRVRAEEEKNVRRRKQITQRIHALSARCIEELKIPDDQIVYRFDGAPGVAVELSFQDCQRLEKSPLVNYIFSDEKAKIQMDVIGPASKGPTVWSGGITGAGVTIAHIETGRIDGSNPYLTVSGSHLGARAVTSHATAIGGIIASTHTPRKGIAYGCTLLSANAKDADESNMISATDWAISRGASIMNMSMELLRSSDGRLSWSDIYYDYVVHYNRILFTVSAGNEGSYPYDVPVGSPGRGYNALAVGNVDGKETLDWSDDRMRASSSYVNPITGTEKPEVSAYGTDVHTTTTNSPWIGNAGSGTSFSAPLVAGIAGLCIDNDPGLADEPATLKAILMASAFAQNIEGDATLSDRDGAGCAKATAVFVGHDSRTLMESSFDTNGYFEIPIDIPLTAGDPKRIVFVYTHPPSSVSATPDPSSYYTSDLDLYLYVNGSPVASSPYGFRNPFEIIDYTPPASAMGRVRIRNQSWNTNVTSLRVGLAYVSKSTLGTEADPADIDDAYEENDTQNTATSFTEENRWLSTKEGRAVQLDDDWYEIAPGPAGYERIRVDCQFTNANGNIDLQLVDTAGTVLASSTSTNDNEFIEYVVPHTGTYYLRVYNANSGNSYDLWWDDLQPNQAPTDIALSNSTVLENLAPSNSVGSFSTTDPDVGDTFTYTLVSGSGDVGNRFFAINGATLQTAAMFNYETQDSYSIRVRSTDQSGGFREEPFTITILDVDESPTLGTVEINRDGRALLQWTSMINNRYTIYASTNLLGGFSVVQSNLVTTPPKNVYTDFVGEVNQKYWYIEVEE